MKKHIEILRELREDNDLKQTDVANILGTTQQHYSKYETGRNELPLRALVILSDYYKVSTDYIMGKTDCKEGMDDLNKKITGAYTAGRLISDVLSLSTAGRHAVIEYIGLQKLKEKSSK